MSPDAKKPGINWLAIGLSLAALLVLLVAIAGSVLDARRHGSSRVPCVDNMRRIGMAIVLYANEYDGKFPPSLGALLVESELPPQAFICPSSSLKATRAATTLEQAAQIDSGQATSYIYLAGCRSYFRCAARRDCPVRKSGQPRKRHVCSAG